jgi:nickel transport protein
VFIPARAAALLRPGRRPRAPIRSLLLLLLLLLLLPGFPTTKVSAHAVFIYARPDGERICTESWFSKKNKVKGGEVRMEDARGGLLASGVTDDAGIACFPAPSGAGDLRFIVLAGQGHRAEFTLPALPETVLPAASPEPAASGAPASPGPAASDAPASPAAPAPESSTPAGTTRSSGTSGAVSAYGVAPPPAGGDGPSLRDIIGGAGWLVGLAGLGAFAASRRKKG